MWRRAVVALGLAADTSSQQRLGARRLAARRRFRRLLIEQFEDRRVLATANDDYHQIGRYGTLTGNGWDGDAYHDKWRSESYVCNEYDEEENCISGESVFGDYQYATGGITSSPAGSFTPLPSYRYDENNEPILIDGAAFSYSSNSTVLDSSFADVQPALFITMRICTVRVL